MVVRLVRIALGLAVGMAFATCALAQDNAAPTAPAASSGAAPAAGGTPLETAQKAKVGTLVNPYADKEKANDQALADEGHKLFSNYGCPGCHGGGGGGGMCPPITNGVWIYGDADDTLFRLVALGSVDLQKQGFSRKAIENIVAPMPSFGSIIKSNDDLWKIISWVKIQAYKNTHSQ